MMPASDRIVEATMKYALRPRKNDREKVIAATLEFVIEEYGYTPFDKDIIDVEDIRKLIQELRETVTLEELAQGHSKCPCDAL